MKNKFKKKRTFESRINRGSVKMCHRTIEIIMSASVSAIAV
jgi:hypothetical protein